MLGRRHNEIIARLDKLERRVNQQGDAHSALMNQMAALHSTLRDAAQKIHDRISFANRPRP